jgi:hypothetical protein
VHARRLAEKAAEKRAAKVADAPSNADVAVPVGESSDEEEEADVPSGEEVQIQPFTLALTVRHSALPSCLTHEHAVAERGRLAPSHRRTDLL